MRAQMPGQPRALSVSESRKETALIFRYHSYPVTNVISFKREHVHLFYPSRREVDILDGNKKLKEDPSQPAKGGAVRVRGLRCELSENQRARDESQVYEVWVGTATPSLASFLERNGNVPRFTSPEELTYSWGWVGLASSLRDTCDDRECMEEDSLLVRKRCHSQFKAEVWVLRRLVCHLQQSCSKVRTAAQAEECFRRLPCSNFLLLLASESHPALIEAGPLLRQRDDEPPHSHIDHRYDRTTRSEERALSPVDWEHKEYEPAEERARIKEDI
ncbi:hypothetical protein HPB47_003637 [Ixodes persulcatus]|uniref:Uncharacterized protein n=1 Tax=Ixodes persulcatus TaxID=34615 RepID=A0AC60PHW3_IXOPE|nr:hypothetical protein HPB47_003637 [Ixodes persulcatus]